MCTVPSGDNLGMRPMSQFSKGIIFLTLALAACLPSVAQGALGQLLQTPAPAATPSKAPTDPLGRDTPYGTIFGFLQAAQSGDYSIAAQYLQMNPSRRQTGGATMAANLKQVMDRAYSGNLSKVS